MFLRHQLMQFSPYCGLYACFLFNFTSARTKLLPPLWRRFHTQIINRSAIDPPLLTLNMKGLMKGFKYFSNMFEEKEPEMQIGGPTDVKHVAHIGIDGPTNNKPAWMNEFNANPQVSSSQINTNNNAGKPPVSAGNHEPEKAKKSRRKLSVGGEADKKSKRGRRKKGGASMDSMDMNEMDSDQTKKNRRKKD